MNALELRLPPLALVLVCAAAMAGLAWLVPGAALAGLGSENFWRYGAAAALAVSGIGLALAGVWAFRKHQTTVNPLAPEQSSALVTSGVYRLSRNPMYLGFLLLLLAWAVWLAHGLSALVVPLFIAYLNRFQIQPEERALERRFGAAFHTYTASVRRWL